MNRSTFRLSTRSLAMLVGLLPTALALPARADGLEPPTYRCAVLGEESQFCMLRSPPAQPRIEERLEPGPHALYLMHLGVDRTKAIEQARAGGEFPVLRRLRITPLVLSGEALYRQSQGIGEHRSAIVEPVI